MKRHSYRAKKTNFRLLFILLASLCFLLATILAVRDYARFRARPRLLSENLSVAGVPLGGLSREQAEERLTEAFSIPIELHFQEARIQLLPQELGFSLDLPAIASQLTESHPSWWAALWAKSEASPAPRDLPLLFSLNQEQLCASLLETLQARYLQEPLPAQPILYSSNWTAPQPGLQLADLNQTLHALSDALVSPSQRVVKLTLTETPAPPANPQNLATALRQLISLEAFNGALEIYLKDLKQDTLTQISLYNGQDIPPDLAYSAASTIKIPILLSSYRRLEEPYPPQALRWMSQMIIDSLNAPADGLMKAYINNQRGPLMVTEDLQELGYQNSFLAGYFEPGSPLLKKYSSPANTRTDLFLDPDSYNQTVPSEVGDLLVRIYHCSNGSTPQDGFFNGEVSPAECRAMLDLLSQNHIGSLLEAGLPPNVRIAHKHGWSNEADGLLHTVSDSAIVYSDGGDYALVIFIHSPNQLLFDKANRLFARLSQCIFNAYNPSAQASWYGQ